MGNASVRPQNGVGNSPLEAVAADLSAQQQARAEEGEAGFGTHVAGAAPAQPSDPSAAGRSDQAGAARDGQGAGGAADRPRDNRERDRGTGEGHWALPESERLRKLEDYYDVPDNMKEMGRGHYGVVRKGTRKEDGAVVAVKTIPKRRAVYVDMLRSEIAILKTIDHLNVVRLLDSFEDARQVYLVFELCEGGELFEPIADANFRFSERQASRLVRKMLLAVQVCHDSSIAHRDLKPENMLLVQPGVESELKLIDFGLATTIKPGEVLRRHVGTPYYIAPEVLDKEYGASCDMWSLGVITYTLLCGYPPFWGDTEKEIYQRVKKGIYAFEGSEWAGRSQHALEFIKGLLEMKPARRLTVAQALNHKWIVHEGPAPEPLSRDIILKMRHYASMPLVKRLGIYVTGRRLPFSSEGYAHASDVYNRLEKECLAIPIRESDIDILEAGGQADSVLSSSAGQRTSGGILSLFSRSAALSTHHPHPDGTYSPFGYFHRSPILHPSFRHLFREERFTAPRDGYMVVSAASFAAACQRRGLGNSPTTSLFECCDIDRDGTLSVHDVTAAVMPRLYYLDSDAIYAAFTDLDIDKDGMISVLDLSLFIERLMIDAGRATDFVPRIHPFPSREELLAMALEAMGEIQGTLDSDDGDGDGVMLGTSGNNTNGGVVDWAGQQHTSVSAGSDGHPPTPSHAGHASAATSMIAASISFAKFLDIMTGDEEFVV